MANQKDKKKEEKLEYLQRGEVRTMNKDVASLREGEAQEERHKIADIRSKEEIIKEKQRQEAAEKEAQERAEAVEEAREEEKKVSQMREKGAEERKFESAQIKATAQERKEAFRKILEKTESKEDRERKEFMARVEAEAQDEGAPEATPGPKMAGPESLKQYSPQFKPAPQRIDTPRPVKPEPPQPVVRQPEPVKADIPNPPQPPKAVPPAQEQPMPEIPYQKLRGTSALQKVWVRIVLSLVGLAILGVIATFAYWHFVVKGTSPQTPEQKTEQPATTTQQQAQPATTTAPTKPEITQDLISFGFSVPSTPRTIDTIIIHTTYYNASTADEYNLQDILSQFKTYGVATHYVIDRNGNIYQLVPDKDIAYHAGNSQMPSPDGRTSVNNFSIGIGLMNSQTDKPTQAQYQSLASLVNYLRTEYKIPATNILGAKDVSLNSKVTDPWNFDWQYFKSLLD